MKGTSSAVAVVPEASAPPQTRKQRLAALYTEHSDGVWRLLRRLGNDAARADDVCQQVFLVAMDRLDDILPGKERAFLAGAAIRISRKQFGLGQREAWAAEALDVSDPRLGPDEVTELRRKRALLERLLSKLSEDLRVAFVLHELEGYTQREIGELLQIPDGTAASRLRRARESFDALLAQHLEERAQ